MMDNAPERIWAFAGTFKMWRDHKTEADHVQTPYVRADLYDAANQNEADAIAAYGDLMIKFAALERENERLRSHSVTYDIGGNAVYTPWGYAK